jgi:hypothetical protein
MKGFELSLEESHIIIYNKLGSYKNEIYNQLNDHLFVLLR